MRMEQFRNKIIGIIVAGVVCCCVTGCVFMNSTQESGSRTSNVGEKVTEAESGTQNTKGVETSDSASADSTSMDSTSMDSTSADSTNTESVTNETATTDSVTNDATTTESVTNESATTDSTNDSMSNDSETTVNETTASETTETVLPEETNQATEATEDVEPYFVGYLAMVNRTLNCVTIYEKMSDGTKTPIKAMVCSCGLPEENTPLGTYYTSDGYEWGWLTGNVMGRYSCRINGGIMFHSVPYYTEAKNDLEYEEFNKLGENASAGCIRLCIEDCKWVFDHLRGGSEVIIYSDATDPGPLGKPVPVRTATNIKELRGWDPTDPDPNSPWNSYEIKIKTKSLTVDVGTSLEEIKDQIKVIDNYDNNLTQLGYTTISCDYNIEETGSYTISVNVVVGKITKSKEIKLVVE